ncbi:ATP-grasp domain-containing protein [Desulfatitalea alkaliphila]|uniref:ATP-grasp domain-containing protein n=1 Tax=Desulfatitalea alkaliphila TaxID=2929485 RepID=A0AA41US75_9BACT|nr:ATP-grasp domain-containing protein [Desulfatitalea alkaliphila]MCJ8503008.1 ATP-grasp domain-containing protein [Desulfatitalea alkaliphila]
MNILVTNAKNRIAYNVVKSLSAKGHHVYCADFVPRAMTYYSRYSSGYFIYPSPFSKQSAFVKCLINKIIELKIDVLIPVYEELFLVSKHKELFLNHVKMAIPDYEKILIAHNKDQWWRIAKQIGVPVPETFSVDQLKRNASLIIQLEFPVLLKTKQGGGGWGIGQVDTFEDLIRILDAGTYHDLPLDRYIVQKKMQGETICVAMVLSHGKLIGKTSYRQIREYPAFRGQATCRVSVSNKAAEAFLQKILEFLQWHGVCQADFIIEHKTGVPYLIDVNPRFWGSLSQAIASGVDFPFLIAEISIKEDVETVGFFLEGIQTRWLGGEIRGFVQNFTRSRKKIPFLKDFFFPKITTKSFDDFSLKDPCPFIIWGIDSTLRSIRYRGNKPHDSLEGVWD